MALGRTREVLGAVGGMMRKRRQQRMIARSPKQQMTQLSATPKVPLQNPGVAAPQGLAQSQAATSMQSQLSQRVSAQQGQQSASQTQQLRKRKRASMGLAQSAMQNPAGPI